VSTRDLGNRKAVPDPVPVKDATNFETVLYIHGWSRKFDPVILQYILSSVDTDSVQAIAGNNTPAIF
jgi:hypothetical protein